MAQQTRVRFAAYRNGAKVCGSSRNFPGHVSESYAKREIANSFRLTPSDIEIIEFEHIG